MKCIKYLILTFFIIAIFFSCKKSEEALIEKDFWE